jgi:hypothetical protein
MSGDHVKDLERHIGNLRKALTDLAAPTPLEELLKIIHRPGWTTPAEFALVTLNLDTMTSMARAMLQIKGDLIKAAGQVKAG